MKRYRKLKLFPHYLYIAQCSCRASHLILGPGGMAALSAPRVPPCQGCARDAALGRAVVASGLHHQPLVPGKYLLNGSASAYGSGRQRCFFQTPVGVFAVSKARWFFPR